MITIEKEILKVNSQTYKIATVYLTNTRHKGWIAEIMFEIFDENNSIIGTTVVSRTGLDYNKFWSEFSSGEYLYKLLLEQEGLNVTLPKDIEKEFVNISENPVEGQISS